MSKKCEWCGQKLHAGENALLYEGKIYCRWDCIICDTGCIILPDDCDLIKIRKSKKKKKHSKRKILKGFLLNRKRKNNKGHQIKDIIADVKGRHKYGICPNCSKCVVEDRDSYMCPHCHKLIKW